jgi:hypothetical protein
MNGLQGSITSDSELLIICGGCLKYSRFGRLPLDTASICFDLHCVLVISIL